MITLETWAEFEIAIPISYPISYPDPLLSYSHARRNHRLWENPIWQTQNLGLPVSLRMLEWQKQNG